MKFTPLLLLVSLALFYGCQSAEDPKAPALGLTQSTGGAAGGSAGGSQGTYFPNGPCIFNGTGIPHGGTVKAYFSDGPSCQWQDRTCSNGILSGSYAYSSCTTYCPFGTQKIPVGGTVTAWNTSQATYSVGCSSQVRTCTASGTSATLSGYFAAASCNDPWKAEGTDPQSTGVIDGKFSELSVSSGGVCAVKNGKLVCWGSNAFSTGTRAPIVAFATGVTQIHQKGGYACWVQDEALKCKGNNYSNIVGDGTRGYNNGIKTIFSSGVKKVALGDYHACALVSDQVWCWGLGEGSRIGDGTLTDQLSPVKVIASGAIDFDIGRDATCAVVNGDLKCWGKSTHGNGIIYPLGSTLDSLPTPTTILSGGVKRVVIDHDISTSGCVIQKGALKCWGSNPFRYTPDFVTLETSGVTAMSTSWGASQLCAVVNKNLKCYTKLYLDSNDSTNFITNYEVKSGKVTDVGVQTRFICYTEDGQVKCLGQNAGATLGTGVITPYERTPQTVVFP